MMRSKLAVSTLFVAVAPIVALSGSVWAQGGGGGGRGAGGAMNYLDRAWTVVSFAIELTPQQVTDLKPVFVDGWKSRVEIMQKLMAAQDRQAAMQEALPAIQKIKTDIDAKLATVLTDAQKAVVTPLLAQGPRRNGGGGAPPAQ